MTNSALQQGQKLEYIWGPMDAEGEASGGRVGFGGVTEIEVGRCEGPMGYYDVAIIRHSGKPDCIVPVHMAEVIWTLPDENQSK